MTDPDVTDDDTPDLEPEMAYGCLAVATADGRVLHPVREQWTEVASALSDGGFDMCIDLTAVDYLTYAGRRPLPEAVAPERFEVVASFMSRARRERIRSHIQVPEADPRLPSLYGLYPGTDFLEREVFDLFGIVFDGHPDLSRILMPENWEGHPLRKDYATGAIPVQFKGAPGPR